MRTRRAHPRRARRFVDEARVGPPGAAFGRSRRSIRLDRIRARANARGRLRRVRSSACGAGARERAREQRHDDRSQPGSFGLRGLSERIHRMRSRRRGYAPHVYHASIRRDLRRAVRRRGERTAYAVDAVRTKPSRTPGRHITTIKHISHPSHPMR
ncbi:hypothetical protein E2R25_08155 [Burkholderia pseudomallei]|nr:hypothetical protein E2R25_08155 [Burkholderia pseudomallei]QBR25105.1 hypothetical protein E3O37_08255 [Burkholderia pseudomallei]